MSAARYKTSTGIEGEFEPSSRRRVLRNKCGIRLKREMDERELEALIETQDHYLDVIGDDTVFTAKLIFQMHKDWLGEIYEWAGSYRTVEMSKSGFTWPPAFRIPYNMEQLERNLLRKKTPLRFSDTDSGYRDLAMVHAELLLVHPFREGNGRLARWISDLMCLQAGLPQPDYGFTGHGSKQKHRQYLDAVTKGYAQDYRELTAFFREAVERTAIQ